MCNVVRQYKLFWVFMKPGTAAFAIQAVLEACPGVGEAMVLT